MINEKIQNVLSRLEKDIDYENSHRSEVPSEERLNCISKNIGMFYNIMLKSINAKKILDERVVRVSEYQQFKEELKSGKMIDCSWCGNQTCEDNIKH